MSENNDRFIFANAYIGAYVKNLMTQQDLMRLAAVQDLSMAEFFLRDFGYGESKEVADGDIEWFIRREQDRLYDLIFHYLPGREEMAIYLYPFDYHNVKVCLKCELLGITPTEDQLISVGDIDWKKMVAMIRDRNYSAMRPVMRDAIIEALDLYNRSGDPQEIDLIMDRTCYKDMVDTAERLQQPFLVDMVKMEIDILNMKTLARVKKMGQGWNFFQRAFLVGGRMTEEFFLSNFEEPLSQLAERLAPYGLKDAVSVGGKNLEETGSFLLYEKLLDDALMDLNQKAKYVTVGFEPIAGYWYAKEIEIDNVRIILNGLRAGLKANEIEKFLRKPYV